MDPRNFFAELRRRNVYKVAVAYAVVAWLLIQVATQVFPFFEIPNWAVRLVVLLLALGFPIALVLAWAFELTPEGIKRAAEVAPDASITSRTGRKLAALTVALALVAAALFGMRFLHSTASTGKAKATVAASEAAAIPEKSIAVLPFENLSDEKANAYFAEGIQDEILTRLSKIADLKVISRTSTLRYKSAPDNLSVIARQLGVAHILEGSVQRSGDAIRVNVQLINAANDSHLWADTYDRTVTNLFGVESDIAQKIAGSLEAKLTGREKKEIASVGTRSPEAYDAYLRALALLNEQGIAPIESAINYLHSAVSLDPQYAAAWAQLGIAESQKSGYEHTPAQLERARQAAEKAVELQPDSGETHASLATYYYYGLHDLGRALAEMERAQQLSPNNASVIFYIGLIKRRQGHLDEAIEFMQQAAALDPRNPDIWGNLSGSYRGKRDFAKALELVNRALALSPDELEVVGFKAEIYTAMGDLDAADQVLQGKRLEAASESTYQTLYVLLCRRRFDEAVRLSCEVLLPPSTPRMVLAARKVYRGEILAFAGQVEEGRRLTEEGRHGLSALRESGNASIDILERLVEANGALQDRPQLELTAAQFLKATEIDKWRYGTSEQDVAQAYAALGDADRAIPLLKHCLTTEYDLALTVPQLQQYPGWDRLRGDARFQALLKEPPPTEKGGAR